MTRLTAIIAVLAICGCADRQPVDPQWAAQRNQMLMQYMMSGGFRPNIPPITYNPYAVMPQSHSITCSTLGGITNCW